MNKTDTVGLKGYDAGKKVSGIKRHIEVATEGLPHATAVTTAEVTAWQTLRRCSPALSWVQSLLCGRQIIRTRRTTGFMGRHVSVQIAKQGELRTFNVIAKRWIVERSLA